jgi:hypothetical protein
MNHERHSEFRFQPPGGSGSGSRSCARGNGAGGHRGGGIRGRQPVLRTGRVPSRLAADRLRQPLPARLRAQPAAPPGRRARGNRRRYGVRRADEPPRRLQLPRAGAARHRTARLPLREQGLPIRQAERARARSESVPIRVIPRQEIAGASPAGISEELPIDGPRTVYGATKLAAELLIAEYASSFQLPTVVNRCGDRRAVADGIDRPGRVLAVDAASLLRYPPHLHRLRGNR